MFNVHFGTKQPITGYIYAVQFEDGAVKIGYSRVPANRFDALQYGYRQEGRRIPQDDQYSGKEE